MASDDNDAPIRARGESLTRERLIGTWRLVSATTEDLATGEIADAWGADPVGYIN